MILGQVEESRGYARFDHIPSSFLCFSFILPLLSYTNTMPVTGKTTSGESMGSDGGGGAMCVSRYPPAVSICISYPRSRTLDKTIMLLNVKCSFRSHCLPLPVCLSAFLPSCESYLDRCYEPQPDVQGATLLPRSSEVTPSASYPCGFQQGGQNKKERKGWGRLLLRGHWAPSRI